jgi:hypothetical protein
VSTRETRGAETFGLRIGPHVNLVLAEDELPEDALIGVEGNGLRQKRRHDPPHRLRGSSLPLSASARSGDVLPSL